MKSERAGDCRDKSCSESAFTSDEKRREEETDKRVVKEYVLPSLLAIRILIFQEELPSRRQCLWKTQLRW